MLMLLFACWFPDMQNAKLGKRCIFGISSQNHKALQLRQIFFRTFWYDYGLPTAREWAGLLLHKWGNPCDILCNIRVHSKRIISTFPIGRSERNDAVQKPSTLQFVFKHVWSARVTFTSVAFSATIIFFCLVNKLKDQIFQLFSAVPDYPWSKQSSWRWPRATRFGN